MLRILFHWEQPVFLERSPPFDLQHNLGDWEQIGAGERSMLPDWEHMEGV